MKRILVRAENGPYEIVCGRGVLAASPKQVFRHSAGRRVFLLSSLRVWRHWGARIERLFRPISKATILFDDREAKKNLDTVEHISRQLVRAGADRRAMLVAVGGGVVGDVAGFVAASYARGVGIIHIPTTLVAQVDSAIGGKTGVNLPEGKNLVGAFYPPQLVLADPDVLLTLPMREYRSGIYEIIKYGVIGDVRLFSFLERRMGDLLRRKAAALDYTIQRSAEQKARVVTRDEREAGLREILNFGHTFAHALESVTKYRRYLHGEAVGMGMIAATKLAVAQNLLPQQAAGRIVQVIASAGALPAWPRVPAARMASAMQADKKTRAGRLRFVLPERIGKVQCGVETEHSALLRVLRECASAGAGR